MSNTFAVTNKDIARILREMALLYEIKGVHYKPRAYERAARSISELAEPVRDIYEREGTEGLTECAGVGKSIAEHIEHLLTTGRFPDYEELKVDVPVDVMGLTSVEGVGPQTVKTLYNTLGITTVDELEQAVHERKVRELSGFGAQTEENIASGIAFLRASGGRLLRGAVASDVYELCGIIAGLEHVLRAEVAGSFRRCTETVGDIDILLVSAKPAQAMKQITDLSYVDYVYGSIGETKTTMRLTSGIDANVWIVPEKSWGAALSYFTGSKDHNVALGHIATEKGWKLSEDGLFDEHNVLLAGKTEEELYEKLGMTCIPPELRENTGEMEAALSNNLPSLIGYDSLKGDLQMHTSWSDGRDSIEERARYAHNMGYEYIAITDHTQSLRMTGGLDEAALRKQMKEIGEVNKKLATDGLIFRVLAGAEVNIMKDGSLDVDDEVLHELDIVGAALHSHFNLDRQQQTKRLLAAIEHPAVHIINHPTARMINKRTGAELDFDLVLEAARTHNVALEVDASPERLDLPDILVRRAVNAGVMLVVNSDAHANKGLAAITYGIANARRGWAEEKDVINTRSLDDMLLMLTT